MIDSGFTPTTATVKSHWSDYWQTDRIPADHPNRELFAAQFDRWLASVKAEAWDEGWDDMRLHPEMSGPIHNPYDRAED